MERKPMIIITHGEDVDGICSAALLLILSKPARPTIYPVRYSEHKMVMQEIVDNKDGLLQSSQVVCLDLSASDYLLVREGNRFSIMESLAMQSGDVTYIDHHEATLRNRAKLEALGIKVVYSENQCTTVLVKETYTTKNSFEVDWYPEYLVDIAQIHDFDLETTSAFYQKELGYHLQRIIGYINYSCQTNDLLARFIKNMAIRTMQGHPPNDISVSEVSLIVTEYQPLYQQAQKEFMGSLTEVNVMDKDFVLGVANALIYSKDTIRAIVRDYQGKTPHAFLVFFGSPVDNALMVSTDRVVNNFSAMEFCRFMGGGGRGRDGGFVPIIKVNEATFFQAIESFQVSVEEFLRIQKVL